MSVGAKFKCRHVEQIGDTARIILDPVISGSEENEGFYEYTPGGQIDLQVVNPGCRAIQPGR